MKGDFVLPDKWAIRTTEECCPKEVFEWRDCQYFSSNGFIHSDRYWDTEIRYGYTEITLDQFKQYVLGEKQKQKEIVGWKFKDGYEKYQDVAAEIGRYNRSYDVQKYLLTVNDKTIANGIEELKQAGVLDLWFTPVFKEEETFCVGDWVLLSNTAGGWGSFDQDVCNKVLKITKIDMTQRPDEGGRFYFDDKLTVGREIVRKATPKEMKAAQTPQIIINGHKGEFLDWGVSFNNGCAKIAKEAFIEFYRISKMFDKEDCLIHDNSNRNLTSITIGKGTFSKEQIKEIADYYLNKDK